MIGGEFEATAGGRILRMTCSPRLEEQAVWVLGELAAAITERNEDRTSFTVELGWAVFRLSGDNRELTVMEPDFSGDALKEWRPEVTTSLSVLAQQSDALRRFRVDGKACRFDDKIIYSEGCLEEPNVYLERIGGVRPGDSGWYVGPVDGDQGRLVASYTFELLKLRPPLLSVLLLPPGFLVVFNGDDLAAVLNENEQDLLRDGVS